MIGDPFYIIELDQKIRKAREHREALNDPTGMVRARIAVQVEEEQEKKMILART